MSAFLGGLCGAVLGVIAVGMMLIIIGGAKADEYPPHDKE